MVIRWSLLFRAGTFLIGFSLAGCSEDRLPPSSAQATISQRSTEAITGPIHGTAPSAPDSTTVIVSPSNASQVVPFSVRSYSGSLTMPPISSNGPLSMTISTKQPFASKPASIAYKGQFYVGDRQTGLLYISITASAFANVFGIPGMSLTVPNAAAVLGTNVYMEYVAGSSSKAFGPAHVDGTSVTLANYGTQTDVFLGAGQTAYYELAAAGIARLAMVPSKDFSLGTPGTSTISFSPLDEMSQPISSDFANPYVLSNDTAASGVTISATSLAHPSQQITATYDGSGNGSFELGASGRGGPFQTVFDSVLPKETVFTGAPSPDHAIGQMVPGNDGSVWAFYSPATSPTSPPGVANISTSGQFTGYTDPDPTHWADQSSIGRDAGGNLYVEYWDPPLGTKAIDRFSPTGSVTTVAIPAAMSDATGVASWATGPDGAAWFSTTSDVSGSNGFGVARIGSNGVATRIAALADTATNLLLGPDNNFWFYENQAINKMTATGIVTSYPFPGCPTPCERGVDFVVGADGTFWAPYPYGLQKLVRFSTSGAIVSSEFLPYAATWDRRTSSAPIPQPEIASIVANSSGIFVADQNAQGIYHITATGQITAHRTFSSLTTISQFSPLDLIFGSDGKLYYASYAYPSGDASSGAGALTAIDPTQL